MDREFVTIFFLSPYFFRKFTLSSAPCFSVALLILSSILQQTRAMLNYTGKKCEQIYATRKFILWVVCVFDTNIASWQFYVIFLFNSRYLCPYFCVLFSTFCAFFPFFSLRISVFAIVFKIQTNGCDEMLVYEQWRLIGNETFGWRFCAKKIQLKGVHTK